MARAAASRELNEPVGHSLVRASALLLLMAGLAGNVDGEAGAARAGAKAHPARSLGNAEPPSGEDNISAETEED